MLSERYSEDHIREVLVSRDRFRPHPLADDREPWESLPSALREEYSRRGEVALDFGWPTLKASLILDFLRDGNRSNHERARGERRTALVNLVLAECVEGGGRFIDQIVNGIWATCEESYWGNLGALHIQKAGHEFPDLRERVVELMTAETGALLAWTLYLLGNRLDDVSPLIRERVLLELDIRLLVPALARDDFWWMGFAGREVNNWNPWICSNWVTVALLCERDDSRRTLAATKILRCLDNFIDRYPRDGGCDEGPSYWGRAGASLFENLEMLYEATDGAIDVFDEPLVKEIGRFIYRMQISGKYFVDFADASAVMLPSAPIVFRYGRRIGDQGMLALGEWTATTQDVRSRGFGDSIGRQLPALFGIDDLTREKGKEPLPRDVWLSEIQVMVARDQAGSDDGLFVAAKGGHNQESHNHNDVGNAIVYVDGKPLLIDAGVEQYTRKTFSDERYDIWTMQSAYHTLPTVNGVQQRNGREFEARHVEYTADESTARLELDLAGAYPPEAAIESWQRTVSLIRGERVTIEDEYGLEALTGDLSLNLLTPCDVDVSVDGVLKLSQAPLPDGRVSAAGRVDYQAGLFTVALERVEIADRRMRPIWGDHLTCAILTVKSPALKGQWRIRVVGA